MKLIAKKLLCLYAFSICLVVVPAHAIGIESEGSRLDKLHAETSEALSLFITNIDGFFGDSGKHEDDSNLIIDVELNSLESRYVKDLHTQNYRVKVRLDGLNNQVAKLGKRIELVVAPNSPLPQGEEGENIDYQQSTSSVHLEVSGHKKDKVKYQIGHNGFKSLFIGARYDDVIKLDNSQFDMNATLRVTNEEKSQVKLSPSWNRVIGYNLLQTFYAEAQYLSGEDYQQLTFGGKWRYKLNSGQALSLGLSSYATTEENFQSEKHLLSLSHRLKLYSSWVFLNSKVFSDWQKARDFSSNPGIQLGLNIYFGH
ncbi:MAG: hypothetical protein V7765_07210 [Oleispira sp.]